MFVYNFSLGPMGRKISIVPVNMLVKRRSPKKRKKTLLAMKNDAKNLGTVCMPAFFYYLLWGNGYWGVPEVALFVHKSTICTSALNNTIFKVQH